MDDAASPKDQQLWGVQSMKIDTLTLEVNDDLSNRTGPGQVIHTQAQSRPATEDSIAVGKKRETSKAGNR